MLSCLLASIIHFFYLGAFANRTNPVIEETSHGIIVYPDVRFSGNTRAVRLQVVSDKIIRVTASPTAKFPEVKSLITVPVTLSKNYTLVKSRDKVAIKTPSLTATVLLSTGAVSFTDVSGKPVLMERQYNGRVLSPAVFEGEQRFGITQTFETSTDDAYYGLGQHQDDQFNYRGQQVYMFQNNTEVAIPFLLSSKNYGILWDNYSITKFGDVRDYLPLSRLKLYSKDGQYGWLTASYSNDREKPAEVAFTKAEADINYPYVDDTKKHLPKDFDIENGVITWEGFIASETDGLHKMRLTYAGYTKVWVDGVLKMDRWRQAWNPGSYVINIPLEKEKRHQLKIQWIPDGGESYLTVKYLNPIPAADTNAYSFSSEAGKQLDYYFIKGENADDVIAGYRKVTGKATIVPKWAMGFWQSRERYKTQDEILNTVREFRSRKIPLDNIVLDWSYWKEAEWGSQDFDASRFPSPDAMIKELHEKYNTKIMISVWPKFYEGIPAYEEFRKKGWLYTRNIADRQRDWIGQGYVSTFYDAFNDEAKKGFWDLIHKKIYTKGIDAWWMDASEPDILSNVSPERRKAQMSPLALGVAAEYLSAYPLENAKGIYYGQRSVDPNKRVFLLTRSGFAGSQHYGASIWSGDIASRWEDMKAQISAGVNFSMSGLPFWTMDIGGFSVEKRYEKPNAEDLEEWRELNTRWYQFGAFVPLFRAHGQFPYREIYNIAPENHAAYQSMLFYNKLRYRLMPYIYSLAGMTYHKDYTIMRGLVMDFPKDNHVKNIGDQFMFGPSLLINPVYHFKERKRTVYLPSGQGWYDLYSGSYYNGGQQVQIDAPYERMPLLVKEGSIIPFGPELQYTSEKPADTLTLFVYTGRNGSFSLYEDADTTYDYEKGQYSIIPFNYNEQTKTLTIGGRKGSFPGMLPERVFRVVTVSSSFARKLASNLPADKEVLYSGKQVTIKL
jgi:alpha-D-xyloside xylohydrolase